MANTAVIQAVIAAVAGSGIGGTFIAIRKSPVETGKISVSAAEGALVVQTGVIDHLKDALDSFERKLNLATDRITDLEIDLRRVRAERDAFELKSQRLQSRVDELEGHVRELERREVDKGQGPLRRSVPGDEPKRG